MAQIFQQRPQETVFVRFYQPSVTDYRLKLTSKESLRLQLGGFAPANPVNFIILSVVPGYGMLCTLQSIYKGKFGFQEGPIQKFFRTQHFFQTPNGRRPK